MSQNHLFSTYISPLDSLVFDSIVEPNKPSDDLETEANLALWTNAQFTYDVQPGTGILDDSSSTKTSPLLTETSVSSPSSSSITYENLANYLDYELPQQQLQQAIIPAKAPIMQQRALGPPVQQQRALPHQPILLPKIVPAMTLEEITKALLSTPSALPHNTVTSPAPRPATTAPTATGTKRPLPEEEKTSPAEEDKRKRNTAASARFRIKKKQREQTMEKTVKEMTEKSNGLENRVKELELEIKWLRGLLIEKNTSPSTTTTTESSADSVDTDKNAKVEEQQL